MPTAPAKRGRAKGPIKGRKPVSGPAKPGKTPPKKQVKKRAKRGQGKAPEAQATFLAVVQTADPSITSDELALKYGYADAEVNNFRAFVLEYARDFSAPMACLRMGYPPASCESTAQIMLGNAYVQLRIQEFFRAAEVDTICTVAQIHGKLWEEMNKPDTIKSGCLVSGSSTRIAAGKLLLQAKGQLQPKPKDADPVAARRVMFIPVPVGNWEDGARASQAALKASTVVDV